MLKSTEILTGGISKKGDIVSKLNLELYGKLFLIRRAEQKIREHYHEDEMKTPVHLSIGKEAIEVGVCQALKSQDQLFGTYRSHGIYLARTEETDAFFAEMYGRQTGLVKGKAGSMHLCAPHQGLMVTSAIVSSAIPVAVGAAYANKVKGNGAIVVVFFGDGATEEGVFWESINVASLMKLPVLFVCEDNELAVYTHPKDRRGYDSIDDIISQYNCGVDKLESTDVEEIYKFSSKAIESVRAGKGPYFLHFKYYRYLEHVGINEDFDAGYRKKEEFHKWFEKDPINIQRTKLIRMGVSEDALSDLEEKINSRIDNSIKLARKSPMTDTNELLMDIIK